MNSSDWDENDIVLAKNVSAYFFLLTVFLAIVLFGVLFGWVAFVAGLLLLSLFANWLLRLMIKNAEDKLKVTK